MHLSRTLKALDKLGLKAVILSASGELQFSDLVGFVLDFATQHLHQVAKQKRDARFREHDGAQMNCRAALAMRAWMRNDSGGWWRVKAWMAGSSPARTV
jgi:hypothetical protein